MSWAGLAVTVRASSVFVRADSGSPWDMVAEARICPNVIRAFRFQRTAFDLLRLPSTPVSHVLGTM
jgi:hypothetical protein